MRGLDAVGELEDGVAEVLGVVAEVDLVGEHAGDELARKVEAAGVNVGDDNGGCACCLGAEERHQTNGTSTADEDRVAELDVGPVETSKGDGERLEHSAVLKGHAVGHLVAPHGGVLEVAAEQSGDGGCGEEFDRLAAVVATCQAGLALVADNVGLDRNAVASFEVGDGLVHSHYYAGRLVAENVRVFNDHGTDASLEMLVLILDQT